VVDIWNREEEKLHHANTGVENPTSHAGIATKSAKRMNMRLLESNKRGAKAIDETRTPPKKSNQSCFDFGTRSG
jgi:recombinational DNA repair protein RecR